MRGSDQRSGELFSYVDLEKRVRADHPLRVIRKLTDAALSALSGDFAALYAGMSRPSIPPDDFKGERRSNDTHRSTTDPDARLYRKGPGMEAKLCFIGHGLMGTDWA